MQPDASALAAERRSAFAAEHAQARPTDSIGLPEAAGKTPASRLSDLFPMPALTPMVLRSEAVFPPVRAAIEAAMAGSSRAQRVLLVMPPDIAPAAQPHLGLAILATRLKQAGYAPLVVDYAYRPDLPPVDVFLTQFEPAVVGISVFSQHLSQTKRFIKGVRQARPSAAIILGGPHITIAEEAGLAELWETGANVLVRGEADDRIIEIVEGAIASASQAVIACDRATLKEYPWPDFRLVVDGVNLVTYPMQLSRGCPYHCIFCNVQRISGRKFRTRDIANALDEIAEAVRRYPRMQFVKVTDDAPNCVPARIEAFLDGYLARRLPARLEIMQLRADHLTPKIAQSLKATRAPYIVLGVEAAAEPILRNVHKGETLDDMRRACTLVRANDLPLVLCFVLGLPHSTPATDGESVAFAREMGATHCYWNVAQPMPGTEMYEFFKHHGRILSPNVAEESSLDGNCYADTLDYPAIERLRMQTVAQASTNERSRHWKHLVRRGVELRALPRVVRALTLPRPRIPATAERRW